MARIIAERFNHKGDCSKDGKEVVKWVVGQSANYPTTEKNKGN
jgi:hypothetical protein